MTGREALEEIKDYGLVTYDEEGNEEDCIKFGELEPNLIEAIERDLELLDSLLDVFKKDILEAFDSYYRDGDNIITKCLIEQLGMVTLKKLEERIN